MSTKTRDPKAADSARRAILASKGRFWRPSELHLSPSTAQHVLADLVASGELRHVRKGLYWRGTKTPLGMSPPPTDALVSVLAPGKGVGPAGLSAANALRLSTQIPRRAEFAVPRRAPSTSGAVRFLSRATRKGRTACALTPTEVAALEVLDSWDRVIEVSPKDAWKRLGDLMESGTLRPERLARASRTEPAPVRARLKALLDASGRSELADQVPDPDPRTRRTALSTLGAR